jgi:CubicO group peptidase (beta-lactamase class C family)
MRILRTTAAGLALTTLLGGVAAAQESSKASRANAPTIVDVDWKPLRERWRAAMKELRVPGMAAVVVQGDRMVLFAEGVCDPAGKQPVTVRSPFYLASVTKSFTALGVAILANEGKVKLDAPVKTYLPRFTLADPELAAKVTVRDLLCHRYGLNSEPIAMAEAYFGNINDDRYYALLALVESRGEFAYSNLHYTLAGRIIEAVTGQKWQDFLAERVFAPLGMRDATCYASKLYANPLAAQPIVEKSGKLEPAPLVKKDEVMHAAGGMGASATDLGHWLQFQLTGKSPGDKELIPLALLREMQKQQVSDPRAKPGPDGVLRDGYTLGWFTGSFHDHAVREHGGGYVGTATMVSFLPEDGIGCAVLVNDSKPAMAALVVSDVYAKLLKLDGVDLLPTVRELAARRQKRAAQTPERSWEAPSKDGLSLALEAYCGTYENPIFGEAVVSNRDGRLNLNIGILDLRWQALGDDRFELEIPGAATTRGQFQKADEKVTSFSVVTPMGNAEFHKK